MITLLSLLCFASFYAFYNSSKRAQLFVDYPGQEWLQSHKDIARPIGWVLMSLAAMLFVMIMKTTGAYFLIVAMMCFASLTVLLMPLRLLKFRTTLVLFLVAFTLEIFFNYAC